MKTRRWMIALSLTSAALGLIGIPSCKSSYDEEAQRSVDASADATPTNDAPITPPDAEPPVVDAGADTSACDLGKVATDPKNCGACGHDCKIGTCTAGACDGLALGTVGGAPLQHIVESGDFVYVTPRLKVVTEQGGLWRVPKAGGAPLLFANKRFAEEMLVVGPTLFFLVVDEPADADGGTEGGLWACSLKTSAPVPCAPQLIAPAHDARDLRVQQGVVYYSESSRIMRYDPATAAPPTVWRATQGPYRFHVDGETVFYVGYTYSPPISKVRLWDAREDDDASNDMLLSVYESPSPTYAALLGTSESLYFTVWEESNPPGGVVRRVARPGTAGVPCDYGGKKNANPSGLLIDGDRLYWTNLGPTTPAAGSIASCPLAGCCADPTILWTGGARPSAITADGDSLYWVTRDTGSVHRLAKP